MPHTCHTHMPHTCHIKAVLSISLTTLSIQFRYNNTIHTYDGDITC